MFSSARGGQGSLAYKIQPSFWRRLLSPFSFFFSKRSEQEKIRNLLAHAHDNGAPIEVAAEAPFGSVRNYHVVGVRQDEKKVAGSR